MRTRIDLDSALSDEGPKLGEEVTDLVGEWDQIATDRYEQLQSGSDHSYDSVLTPTCLSLLAEGQANGPILDVGCGVGRLTFELARRYQKVIGIDPSHESVKLAKASCPPDLYAKVRFQAISAEGAAAALHFGKFRAAVLNMVLMDSFEPLRILQAVKHLCVGKSVVVVTIPHPAFWPTYYGYADHAGFDYRSEIVIRSLFRITSGRLRHTTSHLHRPLESYFKLLRDAGLSVESLLEPWPSGDLPIEYLEQWRFPRFLALRCRT